jgi:hypothetical protein
MVFKTRA